MEEIFHIILKWNVFFQWLDFFYAGQFSPIPQAAGVLLMAAQ
jgi:hypothetical protein